MRYRTTILFLLAFFLGANPAMDMTRQKAACTDTSVSGDSGNLLTLSSGDSRNCTVGVSAMDRLLELCAAVCALGGGLSAMKAWRDRQQDRALLSGMSMPNWGRGSPYR